MYLQALMLKITMTCFFGMECTAGYENLDGDELFKASNDFSDDFVTTNWMESLWDLDTALGKHLV